MHLLTQSALLRALGWSLFNSLWQMSLLWLFYHLILLVFKTPTARARHGLAFLLLTSGFIWSVISFFTAYLTAVAPAGTPMADAPVDAFTPGWVSVLDRSHLLAGLILPWCSTFYLLTLVILLVRYSRQYIHTKRIVREGLSPLSPAFDGFVASTARRMGIGTNVRAYLSSLVDVPITLGFLKPVILLPLSMITQFTPAQIEAILVHELAHIRRKDYLLNLLVTGMELLYFFNPFARLLIAQIKKEREHCCDDAVLEFRYDPHAYVTALLSLARQHQQAHLAVAAIGGGEQLLLQRAQKILQQKRTDARPGPRPLIGLALTALVSILVTGHSRTVRTDRPAAQSLTFQQTTVILRSETTRTLTSPKEFHRPPAVPKHPHKNRHSQDLLDRMLAAAIRDKDRGSFVLNTDGSGQGSSIAFAGLSDTANRDYSMSGSDESSAEARLHSITRAAYMPFVPQSSFAFQYTDTLSPGVKLAVLQALSQQMVEVQLLRTSTELAQQLLQLREQERNAIDTKEIKALLQQEMQVGKQYRLNLERLQQLRKASHHLTIVYI